MKLWIVEIDESDWDYDRFQSAAVWAESSEQAEQTLRFTPRDSDTFVDNEEGDLWIEEPEWHLNVRPAPTEGVVLVHWHAG